MLFPDQDWLVKMPGYPPKNLSSKLFEKEHVYEHAWK